MKDDDVQQSLDLLSSHEMFLGLHEAKTWIQVDPEGLLVAEDLETGCIIGIISGNNYDEHNCFISIFAVKEEHRLNGIGSALWNALMQHCGNRNLGLNPRPAMIPSYTKRGLTLKSPYDQKIYVGHPQLGQPSATLIEEVIVEKINKENIKEIDKYDKSVCGIERFKYNWLNANEPETKAFVALSKATNKVLGYCIFKKGNLCRTFSPIYADSDEIAELLISKCEIPEDEKVMMATLGLSPNLEFMEKLQMKLYLTQSTLFSNAIRITNLERVYSLSSVNFFPF
uniref:N-acetyltransferase domain-containing protein n=1 Tax=Acrobeloides nanus TaxID=290746 RepID=A0A914CCB3_9BILA